jgi:type I restriction-modification system DNA methylase subunit
LGLIFLKFASDKFEQRKKELIEDGKEKYVEMKDFYTMKNVFFLENKLLYKNIMHFTIFVIFNVTLINALI